MDVHIPFLKTNTGSLVLSTFDHYAGDVRLSCPVPASHIQFTGPLPQVVAKKLLIYSQSDLQAFSEPASFGHMRYCLRRSASNCNAEQRFFLWRISPLANKKKGMTNLKNEILRVFLF
jgi:hypothetical protein